VYEGAIKNGQNIFILHDGQVVRKGKITKLFTFRGIERVESEIAYAGDIVIVAGLTDIFIGETISDSDATQPLPAIAVDQPTIALDFVVNNSPFAGKEGKYVTTRQIRERLEKELEINVGLKVNFDNGDSCKVFGRGEMHISILLENMRREGYELQVSQPQAIIEERADGKYEPFEEVTIDIPSEFQGAVIEKLGRRAFIMTDMILHENQARLIFEGPTRGLLGYKGQFIIDTKGEGILCSRVIGFKPYAGEIKKRQAGSMVSMAGGKALGFSLWNLQDRGQLYIGPATEVYEGMVIGNTSKGEEMMVNPTKGKQLSNVRSSGTDEALTLTPHRPLSIEIGLEIMSDDEYLEVTPLSTRLRKQVLKEADRSKSRR
jgi:GTP-binding protein